MVRPILLLALVACSKKPASPAADGASSVSSSVQATGDAEVMHARLATLTAARDHVIAGRHDEARTLLQQISQDIAPSMAPEAWREPLRDLRDSAAEGAETDDLPTLAEAVADSARACGACHAAVGARPAFVEVEVPAEDAAMARHVWAADRMWEGLVAREPARWGRAAAVLSGETADNSTLYAGLSLAEAADAARLHDRVHQLTEGGDLERADPRDQVEVYGAFLATCADCHDATGRGPR